MSDIEIDPIVAELRSVRKSMNIQQKDMADQIGLGPTVLSGYENGRISPQLSTVRRWSAQLGLGLLLVDDEDEADPTPTADDGTCTVRLSKYHLALAMGMLTAEATAHRADSPGLANDLQEIANLLAQALR